MRKDKKVTSLKFKWLGATDYEPARMKITQTNTNKSMIYYYPVSMDCYQSIIGLLEQIGTDYLQIIDNTQNSYYQFAMLDGLNEIPDYIGKIKEMTKRR